VLTAIKDNIPGIHNAIRDKIFHLFSPPNHHGKRAVSIVKGMLQNSRTCSGNKELTDIMYWRMHIFGGATMA
jgi:hypothetical protein